MTRERLSSEIREDGYDLGVAWLLRRLSDLLGRDETVHLAYTPDRGASVRWTVWLGVPAGTGGSQWGAGETPREALHSAYERAVASIFEGRVEVPGDG